MNLRHGRKSWGLVLALLFLTICIAKARSFTKGGHSSVVRSMYFEKVKPRQYQGKTLGPGWGYEYYEEKMGNTLPDFDKLKPVATGVTQDLSLAMCKRNDSFGLRLTGYFDVRKAGKYNFHLTSDDGSRLFIDDKMVVDNDGLHPAMTKKGSLQLDKGIHSIKIIYFEGAGGESLGLKFEGPDISWQQVPVWCEQ